jgi:hypothetical protein
MKTWKKVVLSVVGVLVLAVVYSAWHLYHTIHVIIPNSYAAWTTGELIVEYLETHNDKWPKGWDDLREAKASKEARGEPIYWNFDELPKMVRIDWQADVKQLANALARGRDAPFRVVTKLDGSDVDACWGKDIEPNRRICEYFKTKRAEH